MQQTAKLLKCIEYIKLNMAHVATCTSMYMFLYISWRNCAAFSES